MSLSARLLLVLLVPIALCFGALGYDTVRLRRNLMLDEASHEARDHGASLQIALGAILQHHPLADLAHLGPRLARGDRVAGVLIYAPDDRVFDASSPALAREPALARLAHTARTTDVPQGALIERGTTAIQAYAFPIGPAPRATVVVLRDLRYVHTNVQAFARQIALLSLVVMFVVAAGTWIGLRWTVILPVNTLVRGVERVACGDLAVDVTTAHRDELGRLASAFNDMTRSLRSSRGELEAQSAANVALERRLQHAQRLALIGQLAASLAHEVGSPLNVVLGRARYALKQGGQGERDRRHFEEIVAGAERVSRVIERLLSNARRARARIEDIDVGLLAHETVHFVSAECDRLGVASRVDAEPGVVVACARDELEQVILNLCVNAIQAQPGGGRLDVAVRHASLPDGRGGAEICVEDAGPGVAAELRARVFEPFFTTKPREQGTGLGLAICDELVRRQGGTLALDEAATGGARFRVLIPRGRAPAATLDEGAA